MAPQQPIPAPAPSQAAAPPISSGGPSSTAHPSTSPSATQGQVQSHIQQHLKEFPIAPTLVLVFFLLFMATMLGFVVQKHHHRRKLLRAAQSQQDTQNQNQNQNQYQYQNEWQAQAQPAHADGAPLGGTQDLRTPSHNVASDQAVSADDAQARRRSLFGSGWLTSLLGRGHTDSDAQEKGDAAAHPRSTSTVRIHSSDLEKVDFAGAFSHAGTSASAASGSGSAEGHGAPSVRRKSSLMRAASRFKARASSKRPQPDFLPPVLETPEPAAQPANTLHPASSNSGIYAGGPHGPSSQLTLVSVYDAKKPSRENTPLLADLGLVASTSASTADASRPPSSAPPQGPELAGPSLALTEITPAPSSTTLVAPPPTASGPQHSASLPSMASRDQAIAMVRENRHSNSGFF
ncbi:hypothetical protein CONPUDRAFT_143552 [Coniophora puteana RWD-64-598 SS2]|uniref:Uncharacterized protein n=1 Tax=Coniophora puteana (strain RWD-64-598) TaxID=741705 RepID=A0A5M3MS79_CONPW|nr:uncharacterized protein CONPUDRAFT_143552 [Coniophora puteana RWD-64-598 SS2]EIW81960.1 hypothetical protein CONPUDRAFT_143552 [Coniophora puteana RWD-64-598 SS2]